MVGLLLGWALLAGSTAPESVAHHRKGNARVFPLRDGKVVLEWVSASTFRFCRDWSGRECAEDPLSHDELEVRESLVGDRLVYETQYLKVELDNTTLLLRVTSHEGRRILEEAGPVQRGNGGVSVERMSPPEERFFGLGFRADGPVEVRGRKIPAEKPFLISSLGYGLHHSSPGDFEFDLAATDERRYRVAARGATRFEYYFHFGPTPKEILEEHKGVVLPPGEIRPWHFAILHERRLPRGTAKLPTAVEPSWKSLRDTVVSLVNCSMSAILLPAMDIEPYREAPLPLYRRGVQLARVTPLVHSKFHLLDDETRLDLHYEMAQVRKRFNPFFVSYGRDVEARGHPIARGLPLQFPRDAEAATVDDQFMLGDEILVAPMLGPGGRRSVYLPMGLWTDLRTNERLAGRRRVDLEAGSGPILLARNGSILPLAALEDNAPMDLHYFPKLAAEFFVFEPGVNDYTQLHAGPAADQMRLEIESKATRTYEWVVHHLPAVEEVSSDGAILPSVAQGAGLKTGSWIYDTSSRTFRVRLAVPAHKQNVIFISFKNGGW